MLRSANADLQAASKARMIQEAEMLGFQYCSGCKKTTAVPSVVILPGLKCCETCKQKKRVRSSIKRKPHTAITSRVVPVLASISIISMPVIDSSPAATVDVDSLIHPAVTVRDASQPSSVEQEEFILIAPVISDHVSPVHDTDAADHDGPEPTRAACTNLSMTNVDIGQPMANEATYPDVTSSLQFAHAPDPEDSKIVAHASSVHMHDVHVTGTPSFHFAHAPVPDRDHDAVTESRSRSVNMYDHDSIISTTASAIADSISAIAIVSSGKSDWLGTQYKQYCNLINPNLLKRLRVQEIANACFRLRQLSDKRQSLSLLEQAPLKSKKKRAKIPDHLD